MSCPLKQCVKALVQSFINLTVMYSKFKLEYRRDSQPHTQSALNPICSANEIRKIVLKVNV
jgi:hypothetical protein